MFATSSSSLLGAPSNQPSRISSSSAALVVRRERASTLASFHLRAPRAVSASAQSAARAPGTLFAAIEAPVPVQQHTMPCSARPSATSRAAASLAQAQSSRSPSLSAPCTIGSCPRRRSSSTTASATPVRSSAATAIFMYSAYARRVAGLRERRVDLQPHDLAVPHVPDHPDRKLGLDPRLAAARQQAGGCNYGVPRAVEQLVGDEAHA